LTEVVFVSSFLGAGVAFGADGFGAIAFGAATGGGGRPGIPFFAFFDALVSNALTSSGGYEI
jgi:hypothetical protein